MKVLIEKEKLEEVVKFFGLMLEGKVMGIQEPNLSEFWNLAQVLNLENDAHCEKLLEFHEKFKKPLVPLEGFYTDAFIKKLGDYYEKVKKASEKIGKETEKVHQEFDKYQKYIPKTLQTNISQ